VTPADRRLAALAAIFVPQHGARVLARISGPGAAVASAAAERLAGATRGERLAFLADALTREVPAGARHEAARLVSRERPAVAAVALALLPPELRAGSRPPLLPRAPPPLLVRLCRELASALSRDAATP
jgi:hypothetical protein